MGLSAARMMARFEEPNSQQDAGRGGSPVERHTFLDRILIIPDAIAVGTAWATAAAVMREQVESFRTAFLAVVCIVLGSLFLLSHYRLYSQRACSVRAVEVSLLTRVVFIVGIGSFLASGSLGLPPSTIGLASVLSLSLLCLLRCSYSSWLRVQRMRGRLLCRTVIVGDNQEARDLESLVRTHPETGLEVVAKASTPADARAVVVSERAGAVIVAASALPHTEMNALVRELLSEGVHVAVSTGLLGIDHRRLRAQSLAREPLFSVEPALLSTRQLVLKRALDIVGAMIGILATLPLLVLAALAIKLQDWGPILFRHQRVGRHGRLFTVYKLRTMSPNAEGQLPRIQVLNQREGGPLFKADDDPRVTKVGRLLRAASIDELPQLFNVLMGTMSLVGPRPALPSEVAQFDDELLERHSVRPGITGLWQVEARDNPSFRSYRRLDLFYIENLSIELDLVILLDTVTAVLTGIVRAALPAPRVRARLVGEIPALFHSTGETPRPCQISEGA